MPAAPPAASAPAEPVVPTAVSAETPAAAPAISSAAEPAAPVADPAAPVSSETPATAEPAPAEPAAPEPAKPVAPVYTEFKLPETIKADAATMSAYTNVLGKYNIPQEAGQELIDFHANAMKQHADALARNQIDVFEKTKSNWMKSAQKEFGNRFDTSVNDGKAIIAQFGGTKQQQAELRSVLGYSGTGNHPAVIRLLANMAKKLNEPSAPANGLPSRGRQESPAERRYGNRK